MEQNNTDKKKQIGLLQKSKSKSLTTFMFLYVF